MQIATSALLFLQRWLIYYWQKETENFRVNYLRNINNYYSMHSYLHVRNTNSESSVAIW